MDFSLTDRKHLIQLIIKLCLKGYHKVVLEAQKKSSFTHI